MKVAILSDFHIGYERFREDAYRQAAEALEAASNMADMIVIAGDVFDFRHPKPDVIAEAISLFKKISSKEFGAKVSGYEGKKGRYTGLPIIAISGTHERRSENEIDAIDLLSLAGLVVNANQAKVTVEKKNEKVVVFGVGGIAEERFKEALKDFDLQPVSGAFNLFLFHQSVYEFLPFSDDFIHLEDLPKGFDLYVDGHIHSKVESKCHGKNFLIPGSTVLTQLKEGEQEEKGFFLYDTTDDTYEFIRIKSRRFAFLKINVDGMEPSQIPDLLEKRIGHILSLSKDKPIIRIVLEGKIKDGFKSIDIAVKGLSERHSDEAIIETVKSGLEVNELEATSLREGILDNVSIRDYGVGIFMDRLKKNKYALQANPSRLFDILSSDLKKEIVIKEAMEVILNV